MHSQRTRVDLGKTLNDTVISPYSFTFPLWIALPNLNQLIYNFYRRYTCRLLRFMVFNVTETQISSHFLTVGVFVTLPRRMGGAMPVPSYSFPPEGRQSQLRKVFYPRHRVFEKLSCYFLLRRGIAKQKDMLNSAIPRKLNALMDS